MTPEENMDHLLKQLEEANSRIANLTEELVSSKTTLTTILEHIDCYVLIINKYGIIKYAGEQIDKLIGINSKDLIGEANWSQFIAEEDIERLTGYFNDRAKGVGNPPSRYSLRVVTSNGESRFMRANVCFIPGTQDRVIVLKDLSEEVEAQQKKAESENRYRFVIENTKDGILICSRDRIFFANTSFCNMTDHTREYIYNVNPLELFHSADRDRILSIISKLEKVHEISPVLEARIRKRKGYLPGELSIAVIKYHNEQAALISIRDISQRIETEKKLRESHRLLQAVIENSPIGISVHDRNGTLLLSNRSWRKIWNKKKEDLKEKMIPRQELRMDERDSYLGEYIGAVEDIYRKGGELNIPSIKITNPSLEGAEWISHHFYALEAEDGEVDKVVILTVDLTDSFRTREELRETRDQYKELSRNVPVGIYRSTMEPGGSIVSANPEMLRMFGISDDKELREVCVKDLYVDTSRRRELIAKLNHGEVVENFEAELKKSDGSTFLASITARGVSVSEESDEIKYIEGIIRDITNERRIEEELRKSENLRAISDLAGGIAHDFNNLLMGILGNLSLVLSELDDERFRERLIKAEASAEDAAVLTRQLLTFAKGGVPLKEIINITDILREATRFALSGSMVQAEFAIDDDLEQVEVDIEQITQVIHNIVLNSVQAMPDGGKMQITCDNLKISGEEETNLESGSYIRISIRDSGEGIPPENLAKIFNPYFTTKPDGSGLGLATCYSIVSRHSGEIRVFSEQGKGTEFVIYLPSTASTIDEETETEQVGRDSSVANSGNILVMDDDPVIRGVLTDMLDILGYTVSECEDGKAAVAVYRKKISTGSTFDAVIVDLTIPGGMGGEETVRLLKEIDPDVKVIVSSGYSDNPVLSNFADYGFSGKLAKPFKMTTLKRELESVLNRS